MTNRINEIEIEQLKAWEKDGRVFQLVDVREDFEREVYHIGGVWIPLGEIVNRRAEVVADEGHPVVFYCRKGIRSTIAIQRLSEYFPSVRMYNLRGGIEHLELSVELDK